MSAASPHASILSLPDLVNGDADLVRRGRYLTATFLVEVGERGDVDASGTLATAIDPPPPYDQVYESAIRRRPELAALASERRIDRELVSIARAASTNSC